MKTIKPAKEDLKSGTKIARLLDLDPHTIRRWKAEGCPHHIIGQGLVRYRFDEVLEWRAQRPNVSKGRKDKEKLERAQATAEKTASKAAAGQPKLKEAGA